MKTLFFILISSFSCLSQKSTDNYIISNNFASEAEYFFHEEIYDSAVYYYELGLEYVSEPHPIQQYKYAKALWKIGQKKKAIDEVQQSRMLRIDTNWFSGLDQTQYEKISLEMYRFNSQKDSLSNADFYNYFIDSIMNIDQFHRRNDYLNDSIKWKTINYYDSCNAQSLIQFTIKHGFPAGKNAGWNQTAATFLIHMTPEWFVENYVLLFNEVVKGNLEPWMLARGIDRMFAIDIGEDKVNPYNRYWNKSVINPFLMFYNCVVLGVSPYYDFNWSGKPRKTIHFDYYKENKKFYNTTFEYK